MIKYIYVLCFFVCYNTFAATNVLTKLFPHLNSTYDGVLKIGFVNSTTADNIAKKEIRCVKFNYPFLSYMTGKENTCSLHFDANTKRLKWIHYRYETKYPIISSDAANLMKLFVQKFGTPDKTEKYKSVYYKFTYEDKTIILTLDSIYDCISISIF